MTDELERRLRERLQSAQLPAAPETLRGAVDQLPGSAAERPRRRVPLRLLSVAAVLATAGLVASLVGGRPSTSVLPAPSARMTPTDAAPSRSPSGSSSDEPVFTVGGLLEARDAGDLGGRSVLLRGFWSDRYVPRTCVPQVGPNGEVQVVGELELRCVDGEVGITELDEPILTFDAEARGIEAKGPWLTPYVDVVPSRFLVAPRGLDDSPPPAPVLVRGHFNDPRADECQAETREGCRDRFVIEGVLEYEPGPLEPPALDPDSTPFPSPPAQPPFDVQACAGTEDQVASAGWTTAAAVGIQLRYEGRIYALVTHHLPIATDLVDATTGESYSVWAAVACYREDFYAGTGVAPIFVKMVGGSMYREYEDGRRVPEPAPR